MAQHNTYGYPFDGEYTGLSPEGFPTGDRDGSADDLAEYLGAPLRGGVFMPDGMNSTQMRVSAVPHTMRVEIAPGRCLIRDRNARARMYRLDAPFYLDIPQSGSVQTYKIVMRGDARTEESWSARRVYPTFTTGALQDTDFVKDIQLAALTVPANATSLNNATLTDTRYDAAVCGAAGLLAYAQCTGSVPEQLWDYTVFPETMTQAERNAVESNPGLKAIFDNSRLGEMYNRLDTMFRNSVDINPYEHRVEIKTSQNWVCPAGVTVIDAFMVGGGGGGECCGGCGGFVAHHRGLTVVPGQSYPIVIGAGGQAGTGATKGGSTTAFGFTVKGGDTSGGSGLIEFFGGCGGGGGIIGSNFGAGNHGASDGQHAATGRWRGGFGQMTSTTDPYTRISYAGGGGGFGIYSNTDTAAGGGGGHLGGTGGFAVNGEEKPGRGGGGGATDGYTGFGMAGRGGAGGPNTGGGGGGQGSGYGGAGGSGIVIIYY